MNNEKYILTNEKRKITDQHDREITLYRIMAAKDFDVYAIRKPRVYVVDQKHVESRIELKHIKTGQLGGWIEKEKNLSQEGNAWVDQGAVVFGDAIIEGNAWVGGKKTAICGEVIVRDEAKVFSDDMDIDESHRTDVEGSITICGLSKITASLRGEGVIKDRLIEHPAVAVLRFPEVKDSSKTLVRFECIVGDKKIAKEYEL